jgi:protein MAK16
MEEEGVCYLFMKTVERAHSPKNLWEKVKLSKNFLQALDQISKNMEYWPEHMINRCKQRLTKMRQMQIRMRKLSMKEGPRMVPIKKKTERREATRELKAEAAAKVDLAIERELLERLKQGTYGDIYNFPQKQFDNVLDNNKADEEELEDEDESDAEAEFIEDFGDDDEELEEDEEVQMVDMEDPEEMQDLEELAGIASKGSKRSRRGGGPRIELEYEQEIDAR